jgi:thiosulfate/3-mercaptopyruvate sulfurtransferase
LRNLPISPNKNLLATDLNMEFDTFISTSQLANNLDKPDYIIFDCRFNLASPEWGFQDYQLSHIPGAIYADLNKDLSSPITPHTGRHPLPEINDFRGLLLKWGITPDKQIVVYDTMAGAFAARLWWLLKACGIERVAVLDGGFNMWVQENRPTKTGIETGFPTTIPIPNQFKTDLFITTNEIENIIGDPEYKIIDARNNPRYLGLEEPIDSIAGHIPGAINRFHAINLTEKGVLKSPQILRDEYLQLLDKTPANKTIVYCGSGVTSCFNIVSMQYAGLPGAKIYIGSWSEWIRDPAHPIATRS